MRVIAKKRCRAMVEPPEKGERATLNPNLSTRLNLLFSDQGPLGGGLAIAGRGGERRCKSAATSPGSRCGEYGPGFRGACHRARIRATRWLHPGYACCSARRASGGG